MNELERYRKALEQIIYDCDEMGVDWYLIAENNRDEDVLNDSIESKGYIKGIADYYLKTVYVFGGVQND